MSYRGWVFLEEDVGGVNEKFELNPEANSIEAADPVGKRREAGGVVRQSTEAAFDVVSFGVQRPSELSRAFQQFDRA